MKSSKNLHKSIDDLLFLVQSHISNVRDSRTARLLIVGTLFAAIIAWSVAFLPSLVTFNQSLIHFAILGAAFVYFMWQVGMRDLNRQLKDLFLLAENLVLAKHDTDPRNWDRVERVWKEFQLLNSNDRYDPKRYNVALKNSLSHFRSNTEPQHLPTKSRAELGIPWWFSFYKEMGAGIAGGFIVAFTHQFATTGQIPPFLTVIGITYILLAALYAWLHPKLLYLEENKNET